jgi:hypothetical protein
MSEVVAVEVEPNVHVNSQVIELQPTSKPIVAMCQHIKDDGIRCGTPAVNGHSFCYYHCRAHRQGPQAVRTRLGERGYRSNVPETVEALQLTLMQVNEALGSGRITDKTASRFLYSVQLASNLLKMKSARSAEGVPFKPSIGLSGELNIPNTSADNRDFKSPDDEIMRAPDVVTEIPQAMEEVLAPRDIPEDRNSKFELLPEEDDEEMPATVAQAERALFEPQQLVDFYKAFRKCDRMSPRYRNFERRLHLHQRAYSVLSAAGRNLDDWMDAVARIPD